MKNLKSQELQTKNPKLKRIINISLKILGTIAALLVAYIIIKIVIATISGTFPTIFGRSLFLVKTPSMEDKISVGDLVIVKHGVIENVAQNDVIAFRCIDPSQPIYGEVIIHRAIEINNVNGISITTKGDANAIADTFKVTSSNYIGEVVGVSSFFGKILSFFSIYGIVFAIILSILLNIIMHQINKIAKLRKEAQEEQKIENEAKIREEILQNINKEKENE